jgi:hypothetical protein
MKHLVFTTQDHFTRISFMAFKSPEAIAMIKSVGYNLRPPYLEKFHGFPFNQGQGYDKICWLQPKITLPGEVLWPSIHPWPMH